LLVVEDGTGELAGIFTERDLLRKVLGQGIELQEPISVTMSSNPVVVNPNDSIRAVVQRMQEGGYRHVPVVTEHQVPVGVISAKRIASYLVEHFPAAVYNLPPLSNHFPDTPEGA
jgi:CBS domain-containing protein